jgi:ATP-dependent RNA helicase RhlE
MEFQQLHLTAPILKALAELNYQHPTPIQEQAIPPALEGRDVLGCAQTGTGKTCAFAAPILQRLNKNQGKGHPIRALILTPTRELAIQIQDSFEAYGKYLPLRSTVIFGGVGQGPQVAALKRGTDVLVATPGRRADLYGQGLVDLSRVEIFVLDEADRMLDMGFIHDVKKVLAWLPQEKQTLFFSATMPPEITQLVNSLLKDPVRVAVNPVSSPVEIIDQRVYLVDKGNKTKLLAHLLADPAITSALVFTRTKHGANKVANDLVKAGISATAIHGNKSQSARQAALAGFKNGEIRVLVATDIAARGLDIEYLAYVVNYNLPEVPETYIHRIGRTGRAGRDGVAISFCDCTEKPMLKDIQKLMGRPIPVVEEHPFPMQVFDAPVVKDKRGRTVNPEDAEARAAAKERRRQRDAANKAAAEGKKAAAKPAQPSEPAAKAQAEPAPAKKKRSRRRKPDAQAAAEAAPAREEVSAPADWSRRDPLASDQVMDATARMLSGRKRVIITENGPQRVAAPLFEEPAPKKPAKNRSSRRRKSGKGQEPKQAAAQPKKNEQPQTRLLPPTKERRRGRQKPPELPPSRSHQKDSTEQKSLMKPYYITKD